MVLDWSYSSPNIHLKKKKEMYYRSITQIVLLYVHIEINGQSPHNCPKEIAIISFHSILRQNF
jgi:hypothetical protein